MLGDATDFAISWFVVPVAPDGGAGFGGTDTLPQKRTELITRASTTPPAMTPKRKCPSEIATDSNIHGMP